ncbi:NADH-ubiquinone oxidoreductase-F iron-sulfur binding region domain-containing protein [Rhodococcus rhodochrous]|uniref:NADH-ubiquinone oxidoreductase-F iron-sulfur binding region domain-containing protein n=1 Tax=Rhodococcus rhodochrous TaxID=1829 RepID=UPI001E4A9BA1|nr:NADH-ubiquinone oxidoreductase-F iron-sulfur binding region domain-containing protein [Rhodococcus rhodochrous]
MLAGLTGVAQPWQVWPEVVKTRTREDIRTELLRAGLRGRGGAGYPIAAKWADAAAGDPPRYVVANGDEGDPGSYCDRLLMERDPSRVLEGLALAAYGVGAQHAYVLVRSEYPAAVDALRAAVDEARHAGRLGHGVHGTEVDLDVSILVGAGSYVAGEETALLRSAQGLRGGVQVRPPYPTVRGLAGRPTVVNNVETLAAVPWIAQHGGLTYADLGLPEEKGTKLVSLNQLFRHPGVYEVEFGTSIRSIVETLGGGLRDGHVLRAVQIGGPLGGFLGPDDLDLPLSAPALAAAGAALGHGGIVAIDDTVGGQELLRHLWTFADAESCGACAPCRVGSRQGLRLCSSPDHRPPPERLLRTMERGSLCAFGRGIAGAVRSLLRVYASEFGEAE